MRRLIVNADDFGIHPARNRGIAEAARAGVVTSVSLIANLEGFDDAVALLSTMPPVDVGLHFNLSEGRPLSGAHPSLVGPDGRFPGKAEMRRRAAENELRAAEVALECAAQRRRLLQAGLTLTHLDGHQHIHVYGMVAAAIASMGRETGSWTRLPAEPSELSEGVPEDRRAQIDEYRDLAERARETFAAAGLRTADHFRGLALSGRMTPERLAALVRSLPEGVTELMVHPGRATEGSAFDGPDREAELAALLSPEFRRALGEGEVELVRRGEVA